MFLPRAWYAGPRCMRRISRSRAELVRALERIETAGAWHSRPRFPVSHVCDRHVATQRNTDPRRLM